MKADAKILDSIDPEFVNSKVDSTDLDQISLLLKKKRAGRKSFDKTVAPRTAKV